METILSITEIFNEDAASWSGHDGYSIITNKQVIKMMISNEQSCCESWGYFISEDNLDDFIGAQIIEITTTNTALETISVKLKNIYVDDGGMMFVNIYTTRGMIQFVAYNCHNGYYGHHAILVSDQIKFDEYL